jgi:hypothetical protein
METSYRLGGFAVGSNLYDPHLSQEILHRFGSSCRNQLRCFLLGKHCHEYLCSTQIVEFLTSTPVTLLLGAVSAGIYCRLFLGLSTGFKPSLDAITQLSGFGDDQDFELTLRGTTYNGGASMDLPKPWEQIRIDLEQARSTLPNDAANDKAIFQYKEFLSHNELELVCDMLES